MLLYKTGFDDTSGQLGGNMGQVPTPSPPSQDVIKIIKNSNVTKIMHI